MKIPLAKPEILDADVDAVCRVLRSPNLSQGPALQAFEQALAAYLEIGHAVVVNSGTSALQLALCAFGIGEGDEVILPSFSFMAVTNAILSARATPVFVDVDRATFNLDPAKLEPALSNKTRAIVLVHCFGYPAPARETIEFARRHGLTVIEDACEALGTELHGRKAGTLADIGIFAFYPNKQITTGEGGALVTNSSELAAHFRRLRNQGRQPGLDWLQHGEAGFSYRLSDINCALGLQQLSRIESILCRREALARGYRERLQRNTHLFFLDSACGVGRTSWFTFPVLLHDEFNRTDRDEIREELRERGIETGTYFAPSHLQPALRDIPFRCGDLSVTLSIAGRLLCLPFFHSLTEAEMELVCGALDEILEGRAAALNCIHAANW